MVHEVFTEYFAGQGLIMLIAHLTNPTAQTLTGFEGLLSNSICILLLIHVLPCSLTLELQHNKQKWISGVWETIKSH